MKPTLLFATLSMVLASPTVFAKTELETLRSRCSEQELQIRQLEEENARLRTGGHETRSKPAKAETPSAAPAKPANPPAATEPAASSYTVKAGDSMEKIARKVGASPEKLAKVNGLKTSSIIRPGQKLKVPGAAAPSTTAAASTPVASATPNTPGKTHTVQAGETYFSISKKYGTSPEAIAAANPKIKASSLRPGQVVNLGNYQPPTNLISTMTSHAKVPAPEAKAAAPAVAKSTAPRESQPTPAPAAAEPKPAPTPAATAQAAAAPETPAPGSDKKIRPITIEGEMTYGEFASKHGTDAERLNALNGLDLTKATILAKGSELYVPAQP